MATSADYRVFDPLITPAGVYIEAGTIISDGGRSPAIPIGWIPPLCVDPLSSTAIENFWSAGPRSAGGSQPGTSAGTCGAFQWTGLRSTGSPLRAIRQGTAFSRRAALISVRTEFENANQPQQERAMANRQIDRVTVRPNVRGGPAKTNVVSPASSDQLGRSIAYPPDKLPISAAPASPLGNAVALNVGAGGAGSGRTLYGQAGTNATHGKVDPGKPTPARDILNAFGPDKTTK